MRIEVVSNMFPDEKHPSYGVFVKNFCNILDNIGIDHKNHVMRKKDSVFSKIFGYIHFYIGTFFALLFERYDLIYVHYASHSSIPVLFARVFRKKRVYTNLHGSDVVPENSTQERMQKYTQRILAASEKIIVPSEYFKDLVTKKYIIEKERLFVIPSGGINKDVFYKEKEKGNGKVLKLGYVGRISFKKGWDTLLKACAEMRNPFRLIVVGNGPDYKQMRSLATQLRLDDHIEWMDLQPQEQLRKVYNDIDLLVFPTEREGESLGLVAIEAMACGTPVVASDYAAPHYYVIDGFNGYKFEKGDYLQLACILDSYVSNQESKENLIIGAIKTAAGYNTDRIEIEYKQLFDEQLHI